MPVLICFKFKRSVRCYARSIRQKSVIVRKGSVLSVGIIRVSFISDIEFCISFVLICAYQLAGFTICLYDFYDIGFLFISEIIIVTVVVGLIRRIGPAMFINSDFELFLYIRSIVSHHFLYPVPAVWYVIDDHIAIGPYNQILVGIAGPGCITYASVHGSSVYQICFSHESYIFMIFVAS